MATISDKELTEPQRKLWLKALQAAEIRNFGYAIQLIQAVLKEQPKFLDGRKVLRKCAIQNTKGKKAFLSGVSSLSLSSGNAKKDPAKALESAEKQLEADPYNVGANQLLKEAALALEMPETAAFALQTIIDGNPKDTKTMHALGELLIASGRADEATDVYGRIRAINPADLKATKLEKDASAQATMTKGGWEKAGSYRDLMKNKEEALLLENKAKQVRSLEATEGQIAEVTPQWEAQQESVDLTRRLAKLWEDRYEFTQDEESLNGALYYYRHVATITGGSDAAITRKITDLELKHVDASIKAHEHFIEQTKAWLAGEGAGHEDAPTYEQQLADSQTELEKLKGQRDASVIDEAKRRVERNPTDLQLRFELGERLLEAGNFNDAIPELQKARQNPNARLRAMAMLGRCFVLKGMLDMAARQFEDAAKEMPAMDNTKKDTLYDLALVYEKLGKKEPYLEKLKEIIEVDYSYKDAAQRVEQSYGG